MSIRRIIFWAHLAAGLVAGISIGIMCFTGTVLAFDKQIVAWSERDARRVEIPYEGAERLSLEELQARLARAHPDAKPATAVVQRDPAAAVAFVAGTAGTFYADPYTGEIRQPRSTATAAFMRTMTNWHRYLNFLGETSRPRGKLINGVCNAAFCLLAVSGLYLWMPRNWSWRSMRGIALLKPGLKGKARDFNWHNAIGLWTAPVLIVLTLTAMPISFRWGANALYTLTGTPLPPPVPAGTRAAPAPPVPVPASPEAAAGKLVGFNALLSNAAQETPAWQQMTVRLPAANARTAQAVTVTVRESNSWPRTANTTLNLDPHTGALLRREGYDTMNGAQQLRAWTRFLHTGEALGRIGQLIAGLACLGGCFLVYTGFALAWRRFAARRGAVPQRSAPDAG